MRNILLIMLCFLAATRASAETLYIAAASNLVYCLEELNSQFKKQYPNLEIKVLPGKIERFLLKFSRMSLMKCIYQRMLFTLSN